MTDSLRAKDKSEGSNKKNESERKVENVPKFTKKDTDLSDENVRKKNEELEKKILEAKDLIINETKKFTTVMQELKEKMKTIKALAQCPQVVATVGEILHVKDINPLPTGYNLSANSDAEVVIVKTSDRHTYLLPNKGIAHGMQLKAGDLVALHEHSDIIVDTLPPTFDTRIKTMEVVERPTDQFSDIGGLDKQLREIIEVVIYPITRKSLFIKLGITPCKGVLLYGPPGTGKTMIARAVAAKASCTFLKLTATMLVQMYLGEGARILREVFNAAKRKAPAIIFIDELDAIGMSRRSDGKMSGESQRTMIELLNQMDGFDSHSDVKVMAATNRLDMLDPALLRRGRFDRKINIPLPNEIGRLSIIKLHAKKMKLHPDVNLEEIARSTDNFSGAQCRAVVVEAAMIAVRKNYTKVMHEHFVDAISEVLALKKNTKTGHYV